MLESGAEVPETKSGPPVAKRLKPSWYQFILGFFGGWIILIFFILMLRVDLPPSVRITFLALAFPILIGGTWWVVTRGDKYLDEFELATTREAESLAFRLTIAAIVGFELLVAAGVEWDLDSLNRLVFLSLLWQFAFLKVQRRINRGLKSSISS